MEHLRSHGPNADRTVEYDFEGNPFGITEDGAIVPGSVAGGLFTTAVAADHGKPIYRTDRLQRELDGIAAALGFEDMAREAFGNAVYCATAAGSTQDEIVIRWPVLANVGAGAGYLAMVLDKLPGVKRPVYEVDEITGGDTLVLASTMSEVAPIAGVRVVLIAKRKPLPHPGDYPNPSFGFKRGAQWYVFDCVAVEVSTATLVGDLLELDATGGAIRPSGLWDFSGATVTGLRGSLGAVFDGVGDPIEAGASFEAVIPYAWSLQGVRFIANGVGDLTIAIKTQSFAGFADSGFTDIHPTPPAMVADDQFEDTTLTGYTTSFPSLTCIRIQVVSAATITKASVVLDILKG